jgi:hypothetical protein
MGRKNLASLSTRHDGKLKFAGWRVIVFSPWIYFA